MTRVIRTIRAAALLLSALSGSASAQHAVDRADPSLVREQVRQEGPANSSAPSVAVVPSTEAGSVAGSTDVLIGAVQVDGAVVLPVSSFAAAIEPYLGRQLSQAELQSLAGAVAGVARAKGYTLATASIPQQKIRNGVIRVSIDEGRVDAVEVSGTGKAAVERLLQRIATGRPLKLADLERQLLLASDVAGVSTEGARVEVRGGRRTLFVRATLQHLTGSVNVDNWGSSVIGPVFVGADMNINGLIARRDRLSVGVSVSAQSREYQYVNAGYVVSLGTSGTEAAAAVYYGHLRPGGALRDDDLNGSSLEVNASVSRPIFRSRRASLWTRLEAAFRDSSIDREGVPDRRDRLRTLSLTLSGVARPEEDGRLRARLTLTQGLPLLDATREGKRLASRTDGSAVFTAVAFSAQYQRPIKGALSGVLAMTGQLASRPLLSSAEMGLGGRYFLRGYDFRELSGEEGAAVSAEARFDLGKFAAPVGKAQIYVYGDAGTVNNLRGGFGGGSLASLGGGFRTTLREGLEGSAEFGIPLKGTVYNPSPAPRFSFVVSRPF